MVRPGDDQNQAKDDHPWYLKYGARVGGIIGAFCKCLAGQVPLFGYGWAVAEAGYVDKQRNIFIVGNWGVFAIIRIVICIIIRVQIQWL